MRNSELYGMIIQKFYLYKSSFILLKQDMNSLLLLLITGNAHLLALHFRSSIIGQCYFIYVFCEGIMLWYLVR